MFSGLTDETTLLLGLALQRMKNGMNTTLARDAIRMM